MSAQHTPGKWYAAKWTTHAATTVLVDDASAGVTGKRIVAECDNEQDAQLIGLTPELLAIVQTVGTLLDRGAPSALILDENSPTRDAIRDVLAKLKGSDE